MCLGEDPESIRVGEIMQEYPRGGLSRVYLSSLMTPDLGSLDSWKEKCRQKMNKGLVDYQNYWKLEV